MNERTKQLAEQAGFKILTDGRIIPTLDHNGECGRDLEKFAELIIKECAYICEDNGRSYQYSFTPSKARLAEATANNCSLLIKRSFGVEE